MKVAKITNFIFPFFIFFLFIFSFLFLFFPKIASAEFDPAGKWFLEGSGYAEKSILRVELRDWGELNIITKLENNVEYVTGYEIRATLDASKLDINAWEYSNSTTLDTPIKIPEADPTLNEPFQLPTVTYDGLTYEVKLTSGTSGTIRIYGYTEGIEINSESAVWAEGTEKPDIPDMSSGCNTGFGGIILLFVLFNFNFIKGNKGNKALINKALN